MRRFSIYAMALLAAWAIHPGGVRAAGSDAKSEEDKKESAVASPADKGPAPLPRSADDTRRAVAEDGQVQAISSLSVVARQRGQVTWLVPEHTVVEKGERVLELDHEDLLRQLDDLEVSQKEAETTVSEQRDALVDQKKELEAEVRSKESALELAKFKLKLLHDGPTDAVRAEAKARVERSRAAFEAAKLAFEKSTTLSDRGVISQDEHILSQVAMDRARLDLRADDLNLRLLTKDPEPITVKKAKLDIEVAKLDLAVAKERLRSQLDSLERGIDAAVLAVENLNDQVRRVNRRIEKSILRAPGPGLVEWGMVGHGRKRKIDIGSRVWPGSSLINLPDVRTLKVSTQVGEEIVGSLRVGQRIPIEVIELDGRVFPGEILRIDIWGRDRNELLDDTGKRALGMYGTKVYAVDVKFVKADEALKRGSKARVLFPRPVRKGIDR